MDLCKTVRFKWLVKELHLTLCQRLRCWLTWWKTRLDSCLKENEGERREPLIFEPRKTKWNFYKSVRRETSTSTNLWKLISASSQHSRLPFDVTDFKCFLENFWREPVLLLDVMWPLSNEWERAVLRKNVQLYSNVLSTTSRPLHYSIHSSPLLSTTLNSYTCLNYLTIVILKLSVICRRISGCPWTAVRHVGSPWW